MVADIQVRLSHLDNLNHLTRQIPGLEIIHKFIRDGLNSTPRTSTYDDVSVGGQVGVGFGPAKILI